MKKKRTRQTAQIIRILFVFSGMAYLLSADSLSQWDELPTTWIGWLVFGILVVGGFITIILPFIHRYKDKSAERGSINFWTEYPEHETAEGWMLPTYETVDLGFRMRGQNDINLHEVFLIFRKYGEPTMLFLCEIDITLTPDNRNGSHTVTLKGNLTDEEDGYVVEPKNILGYFVTEGYEHYPERRFYSSDTPKDVIRRLRGNRLFNVLRRNLYRVRIDYHIPNDGNS